MTAIAAAPPADQGPLDSRDRLAIALIGAGHGCSHFFQLVLPPLFPFLVTDMAVSYTQLGLVMSVYFIVSGVGQPVAGFAVDRFGARNVLFLGLGLYSAAIMALSILPQWWMLGAVMVLAGIGNCVFHPADYTVLSASVRASHMGRAFSVHTLGGNLGWVLAPVFVLGIAEVAGWRASLAAAGLVGFAVLALLWLNREVLREERDTSGPASDSGSSGELAPSLSVSVLLSPTVVLCFGYFALIAAALIGVQNFIGPILADIHGFSLVVAGIALTAFLLGASAGVIAGGFAADRTKAHAAVISFGLASSAVLTVLVAYAPAIQSVIVTLLFVAGFLSGMTSPSRDMLVRSVTPTGATGRVFGFVYSGLDVGSAFAPVTVGVMLDHGQPELALWLIGALLLLALPTVLGIRGRAPSAKVATTATTG